MAFVSGVVTLGGPWLRSRTLGLVIAERVSRTFPRYAPVPPAGPPISPTATTAAEESAINLAWSNGAAFPSQTEVYGSSDNVTFTLLATLPLTQTTYKHFTSTFGVTWYYRFRHVNVTNVSSIVTASGVSQVDYPNAAPSGLVVVTEARPAGETHIDVSWTNGDTTASTQIFRRASGGAYSLATTAGPGVASFVDTGRTPNTTYDYYASHLKSGVNSANSNVATAATLVDGPDAPPTSPSAVGGTGVAGQRMVNVAWVNGDASAQTEIFVSADGTNFALLTTIAGGVASYIHDAGAYNVGRWYYFRHTKGGIVTTTTSTVSAVSGQDIPDGPPSGLSVTVPGRPTGETNLNLSWTNGDLSCSTKVFYAGSVVGTVGAGVTSFSHTGLTPNTSYAYQVLHTKNGVDSGPSNTGTGVTLVDGPNAGPSGLSVTDLTNGLLRLTWTNGDTTANTEIIINNVSIWTVVGPGVATLDVNIGNGVTSTWYVRHVKNSVYFGANSNTVSYTTPSVPQPVTGVTATVRARPTGETVLDLAWTNHESAAITDIYISTDNATWTLMVSDANPTATQAVSGLAPGTTYYFLFRVHRNSLNSSDVTVSTTTLVDGPDAAPSGMGITNLGGGTIRLTWTNGDASASTVLVLNGSGYTTVGPGVASYDVFVGNGVTTAWYAYHTKNGVTVGNTNTASYTTASVPLPVVSASVSPLARPDGETQMQLSWSNQESAATTLIYQSPDNASWVLIASLANPTSNLLVTGLATSTSYWFLIRVTRDGLNSSDVNVANTTLVDGPDANPTGLFFSDIEISNVTIEWTNGDSTAQTKVFRNGSLRTTLSPGVSSYLDSVLRHTTYSWYVQHVKNSILSDSSDIISTTTP